MPGSDGKPSTLSTLLGDLAYRDGDGELPVLLLHAVGGSSHLWEGVVAALAPRVRAVAPDFLGHGRSGLPARPLTIPDHADLCVELLDALDLDRVVVAGTSMGALVGLELAARHPSRVHALVANGCPGWHLESQRMERFVTLAGKVGRDGLPRPDSELGGTVRPPSDADVARRRADLLACGPWFLSSLWAVAAYDPTSRLERITCPSLVLMGDADPHLATSSTLVGGIRDARLQVVPDAGHLTPFDAPRAVADAVTRIAVAPRPLTHERSTAR